MEDKKDKKLDVNSLNKKPYNAPKIESESLITFGAKCNGTTNANRKQSTSAPFNCNASRLLS